MKENNYQNEAHFVDDEYPNKKKHVFSAKYDHGRMNYEYYPGDDDPTAYMSKLDKLRYTNQFKKEREQEEARIERYKQARKEREERYNDVLSYKEAATILGIFIRNMFVDIGMNTTIDTIIDSLKKNKGVNISAINKGENKVWGQLSIFPISQGTKNTDYFRFILTQRGLYGKGKEIKGICRAKENLYILALKKDCIKYLEWLKNHM